jgi:hypothetical protein
LWHLGVLNSHSFKLEAFLIHAFFFFPLSFFEGLSGRPLRGIWSPIIGLHIWLLLLVLVLLHGSLYGFSILFLRMTRHLGDQHWHSYPVWLSKGSVASLNYDLCYVSLSVVCSARLQCWLPVCFVRHLCMTEIMNHLCSGLWWMNSLEWLGCDCELR